MLALDTTYSQNSSEKWFCVLKPILKRSNVSFWKGARTLAKRRRFTWTLPLPEGRISSGASRKEYSTGVQSTAILSEEMALKLWRIRLGKEGL